MNKMKIATVILLLILPSSLALAQFPPEPPIFEQKNFLFLGEIPEFTRDFAIAWTDSAASVFVQPFDAVFLHIRKYHDIDQDVIIFSDPCMQRLTIWQCTARDVTRNLDNIQAYYGDDVGGLNMPSGLTTNAIGREFDPESDVIYLADRGNDRILELRFLPDPDGGSLRINRILAQGYVNMPLDIAIANYGSLKMSSVDLFIVGTGHFENAGELVKIDIEGNFKGSWNKIPFPADWGETEWYFDQPIAVACYPDTAENTTDIYITEASSNTLFYLTVTPSNDPECTWARTLEMGEKSYRPGGIAFDGFGRIYAANAMRGKIESFGPDFTDYYPPFGELGDSVGQFYYPQNIIIDNYDGICEVLIFEIFSRNSGLSTYYIANGYSDEGRPQGFRADSLIYPLIQSNVQIPIVYALHSAYPNPFNSECRISYDIPERTHVSIEVFNILGQKVSTLVNETKEPGKYWVTLNASKLSSGVYFYGLKTDNYSKTKSVVLIK